MREYAIGTTFDIKFNTVRFSTGAPFTLAGTPTVAAYLDNSTTEITAGITLTVDFDARTGLHNVRVVATGANGYVAGNYSLVLTAGTVDSVSVVGMKVGEFSLEVQNRHLKDDGTASYDRTTDSLQAQRDSAATVNAVADEVHVAARVRFKANAAQNYRFTMRDSSTKAPITGRTVTARRQLDGGADAAATGTVSEAGNGVYRFAGAAGDFNCVDGTHRFTATGADEVHVHFVTVP